VGHSNGWDFGCNIGELDGEVRWATKRGDFGHNMGESGGVIK